MIDDVKGLCGFNMCLHLWMTFHLLDTAAAAFGSSGAVALSSPTVVGTASLDCEGNGLVALDQGVFSCY
jgi:hypothetical protein